MVFQTEGNDFSWQSQIQEEQLLRHSRALMPGVKLAGMRRAWGVYYSILCKCKIAFTHTLTIKVQEMEYRSFPAGVIMVEIWRGDQEG